MLRRDTPQPAPLRGHDRPARNRLGRMGACSSRNRRVPPSAPGRRPDRHRLRRHALAPGRRTRTVRGRSTARSRRWPRWRRGAQLAVITGRDARTVVRLAGLDAVPGLSSPASTALETWTDGDLTHAGHARGHGGSCANACPGAGRRRPGPVDRGQAAVAGRARPPARTRTAALAAVADAGDRARRRARPRGPPRPRRAGAAAAGLRQGRRAEPAGAEGRTAVLFVGDDLGDLPAFAEIGRLRDAGGIAAWASPSRSVRRSEAAVDAADAAVADPRRRRRAARARSPAGLDAPTAPRPARRAGPGTTRSAAAGPPPRASAPPARPARSPA